MSKVNQAIKAIHYINYVSSQKKWLHSIHPLSKLLVTLLYIITVVSFDKYNIAALLTMSLYLLVVIIVGDVPIRHSFVLLKPLLLLVCTIGLANPFLDRSIIATLGTISITGGMVSMITLVVKGVFAMLASYVLIITTSIEKICYALRLLRVPQVIITLVILMYRYLVVLLKEVERISMAYSLRAPRQKGVQYKAWGSFAGLLLLRSIDRAQIVYESMLLRGYSSQLYFGKEYRFDYKSFLYLICWSIFILLLRFTQLFEIAGKLFI